ncbi:hypothetical protein BLOT_016145 [Blomia tropicalis]|nr:hypothetical protein BLOT_016145 [Blomia tropicalis]
MSTNKIINSTYKNAFCTLAQRILFDNVEDKKIFLYSTWNNVNLQWNIRRVAYFLLNVFQSFVFVGDAFNLYTQFYITKFLIQNADYFFRSINGILLIIQLEINILMSTFYFMEAVGIAAIMTTLMLLSDYIVEIQNQIERSQILFAVFMVACQFPALIGLHVSKYRSQRTPYHLDLRAKFKLHHYIYKYCTKNRYGITCGSFGLVTFKSFSRFMILYLKFLIYYHRLSTIR